MFLLDYNSKRSENDGQFLVGLADFIDKDYEKFNRLYYWCDKEHLKRFFIKLLLFFTMDEIKDMIVENIKTVGKRLEK